MISEQRRLELEKLAAVVNAAHDRYYYEMDEEDFADELEDDDGEDEAYTAWHQAILRQREIGFDAFAAETKQKFADAALTGEDLHFLMTHYNYDDGAGLPLWVIAHPACTLATAQQVYWLCQPAAFYQDHGSPQNVQEDSIHFHIARLLVAIEEKARSGGFAQAPEHIAAMFDADEVAQIPAAPLDKIPAALWQGLV